MFAYDVQDAMKRYREKKAEQKVFLEEYMILVSNGIENDRRKELESEFNYIQRYLDAIAHRIIEQFL